MWKKGYEGAVRRTLVKRLFDERGFRSGVSDENVLEFTTLTTSVLINPGTELLHRGKKMFLV